MRWPPKIRNLKYVLVLRIWPENLLTRIYFKIFKFIPLSLLAYAFSNRFLSTYFQSNSARMVCSVEYNLSRDDSKCKTHMSEYT